jgi:hypothetical protein
MKKFFITLTFISAFSLISTAQITVKPGGGFHYLTLTRSTENWDRFGDIGYQLGGTVTIGRLFYFEPGIFWMSNTCEFSQIDGEDGFGPIRMNHRMDILRVPLLAGYSFWDSQGTALDIKLLAGPAINFVLGADNSKPYTSAPVTSDYKTIFWGGDIGISLAYWWLFLDAGFEFGLSKVYKTPEKFGSAKANIFYLNLGVRLRL